nr:CIH_HP1_G0025290.mRNA.1.CDS.1 [Saccharomyces cerevisiae]
MILLWGKTSTSPKHEAEKSLANLGKEQVVKNGKNNNHQGEEDVPEIFNKNLIRKQAGQLSNNNDNGEVQDVAIQFFLPSEDESGPVQSSVKTF